MVFLGFLMVILVIHQVIGLLVIIEESGGEVMVIFLMTNGMDISPIDGKIIL